MDNQQQIPPQNLNQTPQQPKPPAKLDPYVQRRLVALVLIFVALELSTLIQEATEINALEIGFAVLGLAGVIAIVVIVAQLIRFALHKKPTL